MPQQLSCRMHTQQHADQMGDVPHLTMPLDCAVHAEGNMPWQVAVQRTGEEGDRLVLG